MNPTQPKTNIAQTANFHNNPRPERNEDEKDQNMSSPAKGGEVPNKKGSSYSGLHYQVLWRVN